MGMISKGGFIQIADEPPFVIHMNVAWRATGLKKKTGKMKL